jgi:hypothetical protein
MAHSRPQKNITPGGPGVTLRTGAGNETRTRDPDLGKVVLYQLSYSRFLGPTRGTLVERGFWWPGAGLSTPAYPPAGIPRSSGQAARRYDTMDHKVSTAATTSSATPIE